MNPLDMLLGGLIANIEVFIRDALRGAASLVGLTLSKDQLDYAVSKIKSVPEALTDLTRLRMEIDLLFTEFADTAQGDLEKGIVTP